MRENYGKLNVYKKKPIGPSNYYTFLDTDRTTLFESFEWGGELDN